MGLKAIEDYYKRHNPFDDGRVLGIERRVEIDLDGTAKYRVHGFVDRLMEKEDGHYEIHDYKTSGSLPEQGYFDKDRQLALYDIGIRQAWNEVKCVDLVWHYVVFDKEMHSRRAPEQLEQLKQDTIALIDTIESTTEFPPTESNLCQWCDYQDICPLHAHDVKTKALPVNEYLNEEGVELVNKYAILEEKKKALKCEIDEVESEQERIKEAVVVKAEKENVSRLYGSDKVLNVKEDVKINYPKSGDKNRSEFAVKMGELGLWDVVTDINWSALKKVALGEKWGQKVPDDLKEFISVEKYKKVSMAKKKDKEG